MLKKSAFLAILLAFVFTAAQAQKKGNHDFDPAKRAEKQTAMMTEKLALNADQSAKVKEINLRYAEKAKAQFANKETTDKAQMKAAHKAMRTEQKTELTKVLTKEQAAKWEQMKAERKGKGPKGKGKGPGRGFDPAKRAEMHTARMTESLGLSADQAAKIKAIHLKYDEKAKAAHDANAGADKGKMREAQKTIRTERENEIKQVLTKEQAAKWEQQKAERRAEQKAKRGNKAPKGAPGQKQLKPGKEDLQKQ